MNRFFAVFCAFALLVLTGCSTTMQNGQVRDTTGHPAAKGVHVKVAFPEGWQAHESPGRSVVFQFSHTEGEEGDLVGMMQLLVYDIDPEGAAAYFRLPDGAERAARYQRWRETLVTGPTRKLIDVSDTSAAGRDSVVMADLSVAPAEGADGVYSRLKMLYVYDDGKMLSLACGVAAEVANREKVDAFMDEKGKKFCRPYFDSLEFAEKPK